MGRKQAAVLAYLRDFQRTHGVPPSRAEIALGVGLRSQSTAAYHVRCLVQRGFLASVGPRRTIKLLDDDCPVVRLGPIEPSESVTDPARTLATVPTAAANEFRPHPSYFAVVADDSMGAAGLHAGDRVAIIAEPPEPPEPPPPGAIVLVRWKAELLLRRYRKPRNRNIYLEPESRRPEHPTITTVSTNPAFTLEGRVIGALVCFDDRES